ncbi:MAG: LPS assembly protein LptD [Rickettsiales bacterium]|jgi:LPS-assembly protein|nr:LPS assembly protein LptD [Rickettsiales bacterium]
MPKKILSSIIASCFFLLPSSFAAPLSDQPKDIYADEIYFDARTGSVRGKGNASVKTAGGQQVYSDFMSLSKPSGEITVQRGEIFLSPRVQITAREIVSTAELTKAFDMTFTACWGCDMGGNAWEFHSAKMLHDRENRNMHFYSSVLYWRGLPVVWLPYFSNPDPTVKRRSGLLMPYVGATSNFGTLAGIPLYIAFSDYHDLTLSPTYLSRENPFLKAEHRLNLDYSEFKTTGSYTRNKAGRDRWHVFNKDRMELGSHALLEADVNRTSDKLYLKEYEFYDAQPYLATSAKLTAFGESGYVKTEARSFQELRQNKGNERQSNGDILPRVSGAVQTGPIIGNSYLNLKTDFMNLSGNSESANTTRLVGDAKYTYPFIILWGQKVELSAGARYDVYQFQNANLLTGQTDFTGMKTRFLPSASAALSWPLVKRDKGMTQIFEPKARMVFIDHTRAINFINQDSSGSLFTDASVFADNRYSGYDLWNDGSFADYGAEWSAFDDAGRGVEAFAGQSYDFYAPQNLDPNSGFRLGGSDFVGRLKIRASDWLAFSNRFRMDRDNASVKHLESDVRIGGKDYVNFGFMHAVQFDEKVMLENKFDEIIGGFGIGITERLRVDYRITYNMTESRLQTRNIGILYDHPCYSINLGYREDRSESLTGIPTGATSYRIQFNLKMQGQ